MQTSADPIATRRTAAARRSYAIPAWVRAALVAGLPLIAGSAGTATALAFFASWGEGGWPFLLGLGAGVGAWAAISLAAFSGFANPRTADGSSFEELCVHLTSLCARRESIRAFGSDEDPSSSSLRIADAHIAELKRVVDAPDDAADSMRWLSGWGYIALWRRLHRAEEGLLERARPEELVAAAIRDRARLEKSSIDGRLRYLSSLDEYLGGEQQAESSDRDWRQAAADKLDTPPGRALLREVRFLLNCYRDDRFAQLVHRRNLVFVTMVFTGITTYAVLALAVVWGADEAYVAAGIAYYLIGAVIGLFSELYYSSRRTRGFVHDYGLAFVRLATTPLLSGIAAVGGVALTHLGGSAADGGSAVASMFEVSPTAVIAAAVFGLTPGLLLDRLRQQTETYKEEIASSGIASAREPSDRSAASAGAPRARS